jgi:NAD(P)-dependent dehydrogenase (short-subunit alcohol dehydrogenase family)
VSVLLITGCSGIAAATARLAANRGASIFIAGLDERECTDLSAEIGGGFHCGDLREAAHAERAILKCVERYGRIDGLFNVAGISGRKYGDGPVHECSEDGWNVTMASNVKSIFLVSRAALPHMMRQGGGAILNMGSVLAFAPEPNYFATHAYAASKGAIVALTKAMAAYYAPRNIRVNCIAPGLVRTPMSRRAQQDDEVLEFMETKQPLARGLLEATDIAETATFLLNDKSSRITGQVITVDGGWSVTEV